MRNIFAGLLAAAGVVMFAGAVSAQTYSGIATAANNKAIGGSFNVTLQEISSTQWAVTNVQGLGGNSTSTGADHVTFTFYQGANFTDPISTVTFSGTSGTNAGLYTNWGAGGNGADGNYEWEFGGPGANSIKVNGSNIFETSGGYLTTSDPVRSVTVAVQDGGQWDANIITPEVSTLWLLIAAIVPLGLIARRRSSASRIRAG